MARRFHFPALGGLLTTAGGLVTAIAAAPELAATTVGKLAVAITSIGAVVQAVTKPLAKDPPRR